MAEPGDAPDVKAIMDGVNMDMLILMLIAGSISGMGLLGFKEVRNGTSTGNWLNKPIVAFCLMVIGVWAIAACLLAIFRPTDFISGLIFGIALGVFSLPPAIWFMAIVANSIAEAVTTGGASGIRQRVTCDQADRAVRARQYGEAERLYLEGIQMAIHGSLNPSRGHKGIVGWLCRWAAKANARLKESQWITGPEAPIRLAYGNFLANQERRGEAALQWAEASRGDLPEEQAIMAAVRAADVFLEAGGRAEEARRALSGIVERFPNAPEMPRVLGRFARVPGMESWAEAYAEIKNRPLKYGDRFAAEQP